MFDFSGSELMLIGVVALIAIGPKDLPVAIRAISGVVKKLRRMAGEFQHHVDDMMREADMQDVRQTFNDIRGLNLRNAVQNTIDPDRNLSRAFDDPFQHHPVTPPTPSGSLPHEPAASAEEAPPAFIPPGTASAAPAERVIPFVAAAGPAPDQADDI